MADVLDRRLRADHLRLVLGAIALWKAVEIAVLGHPVVALPMLGAGVLVLVHRRAGAGMVALVALTIVLMPSVYGQPSVNHLTWVFWIALTMAIFDGHQQRFVLRCQLSIMYGFAAIAKIWPEFLDGSALATRTWVGAVAPTWSLVVAAWATLVVEAALAAGVWLRRPWWTWCFAGAVALHASFLFLTVTDPWRIGRLLIFGGLSVAVWLRAGPGPGRRRDVTGPG